MTTRLAISIMFFNALLAITVSAITYAVALPPQALYVKGTSPGNDEIAGDNVPDTSLLPGFASLPKNDTPPLLHTSPGDRGELLDDAPFAGLCKQVALGGHGEIGQTTLEGKCLDTEKGNWWLTSLNLNRCIGNEGGVMVYQVEYVDSKLESSQVLTSVVVASTRRADHVRWIARLGVTMSCSNVTVSTMTVLPGTQSCSLVLKVRLQLVSTWGHGNRLTCDLQWTTRLPSSL